MKMLETRKRTGYTIRRYADEESDVRQTTIEVPLTALRAFSMARVLGQIEIAHRGVQIRIASALKRQQIFKRLDEGWKPLAIAHEVGCTDSYVRRLKNERGGIKRVRAPQKATSRPKAKVTYEFMRKVLHDE